MNILIFSQYYYPEQFLINEITEELVHLGHKITVITGLPNYPGGVIYKGYENGQKRDEIIKGVRVLRCPIVPRGKSKVQLLRNYISYMNKADKAAENLNEIFDVVFLYQLTPITQVVPAHRFCKKHKLKLLMYNCDLAPLSGEDVLKNSKILHFLYASFSKRVMHYCDMIAVTSKSFLKYNHEVNNVPYNKMVYLPQHASGSMLEMDLTTKDNGIADFMFAGNIGCGMGYEYIVKAVKKIPKNKSFLIHIVGDGSGLKDFKAMVERENLKDYFVFHGRYLMSEMPNLYKLADALLITLRNGQITVPSKLQTYMTTGKPIFGAMDGSGKEIIEEANCGKCVFAGDADGLAEILESYIDEPDAYIALGENGRKYFLKNFTKDIYMNHLIQLLEQVKEN